MMMKDLRQMIFRRLARFYKASYIKNPFICESVIAFIHWPVIKGLYRRLYFPKILRKARSVQKQIAIEVDNVCNLQCVMCPYPEITRPRKTMPLGLFKKIVDDARKNHFEELNLTLYNEPLLDEFLFERIAYAKQRGLKVGFTSNATCLSAEKAEKILASGLDWIVFSVDSGSKSCYEHIRKGAQFDAVCSHIKGFLKRRREMGGVRPLVVIHATIVSRKNLGVVRELTRLFPEADHITTALADSRRKTDFLFAGKFFSGARRQLYPCPILWGAPTILSTGKVVFCCKDYNGTIEIGDLNEQSLDEVLSSEKLKRIKESHLAGRGDTIALCKNCDSLYRAGFSWWAVPEVSV